MGYERDDSGGRTVVSFDHLVVIETQRVKSYIFGTPKLREMRGAFDGDAGSSASMDNLGGIGGRLVLTIQINGDGKAILLGDELLRDSDWKYHKWEK